MKYNNKIIKLFSLQLLIPLSALVIVGCNTGASSTNYNASKAYLNAAKVSDFALRVSVSETFMRTNIIIQNSYSGLLLETKDNKIANDATLVQNNPSSNTANQRWDIISLNQKDNDGSPLFKVQLNGTTYVLDNYYKLDDLRLRDYGDVIEDKWKIFDNKDGTYSIQSAAGNKKFLDLSTCNSNINTKIWLSYPDYSVCNKPYGESIRWKLKDTNAFESRKSVPANFSVKNTSIINIYSDKAIDTMYPIASGNNVSQWEVTDYAMQKWDITPISGKTDGGTQLFKIAVNGQNLAMDNYYSRNEIKLTSQFNPDIKEHQWKIYSSDDGSYFFQNMGNDKKFLDLEGCNQNDGTKLKLSYPDSSVCDRPYGDSIQWKIGALQNGDLEKREFINNLSGEFAGMVYFAQTHVIAALTRPFDPLMIPNREALLMLLPESGLLIKDASAIITVDNTQYFLQMKPAANSLKMATDFSKYPNGEFNGFDKDALYDSYTTKAWIVKLPPNLVKSSSKISFSIIDGEITKSAVLKDMPSFLNLRNDIFINSHIFACTFAKDEQSCFKSGNPFLASGDSKQLERNNIAAREVYSQYPVNNMVSTAFQFYVPYVLYRDPTNNKIARLDGGSDFTNSGVEALTQVELVFGGSIIANIMSPVGSNWNVFAQHQFSQPFLNSGNNTLPWGWGAAHCGTTICRYGDSYDPAYNHEFGHGWGLADNGGLALYEDFGYRSYSNELIPNYALIKSGYTAGVMPYVFDKTERYYWISPMGFQYKDTPAVHSRPSIGISDYSEGALAGHFGRFSHLEAKLMQSRVGDNVNMSQALIPLDYRQQYAGWWWEDSTASYSNNMTPTHTVANHIPRQEMQASYIIHGNLENGEDEKGFFSDVYPIAQANYAKPSTYQVGDYVIDDTLSGDMVLLRGMEQCLAYNPSTSMALATVCDKTNPSQRWLFSDNGTTNRLKVLNANICLDYTLKGQTCNSSTNLNWVRRNDGGSIEQGYYLQNSVKGTFITIAADNSLSMKGMYQGDQWFSSNINYLEKAKLVIIYSDGKKETLTFDKNMHLIFSSGISGKQTKRYALVLPISKKPVSVELYSNNKLIAIQQIPDYKMFTAWEFLGNGLAN